MSNSLTKICIRCKGRKKIYKLGHSQCYSLNDTGGTLMDCPLCLGEGRVKNVRKINSKAKAEAAAPTEVEAGEAKIDPISQVDSSNKDKKKDVLTVSKEKGKKKKRKG